jgi:YD repeat-containing protein
VSNITAITDSVWTGSRTFTYDALNRLLSASGPFGANQTPVSQGYRYDPSGNLLEKAGVYCPPPAIDLLSTSAIPRSSYQRQATPGPDGAQK